MATSRALIGCLTFAASAWASAASVAADPHFVVVCNQSNRVAAISAGDLRRLFTGGIKQWDSGAVVRVGIIPSDAPETRYLAGILDVSTTELLSRIQQQVFKGEMRRPAVLRSSAECVAFARSDPGGVCIADARIQLVIETRAVGVE